ncbi:hypothetical protein PSCLAVI8L_130197 [Pseudoclavibacter sp. 8L]|nr:hypothetical protein PSCLAVI8L_130197 [Pseudoclavibacter sp. 8L]
MPSDSSRRIGAVYVRRFDAPHVFRPNVQTGLTVLVIPQRTGLTDRETRDALPRED